MKKRLLFLALTSAITCYAGHKDPDNPCYNWQRISEKFYSCLRETAAERTYMRESGKAKCLAFILDKHNARDAQELREFSKGTRSPEAYDKYTGYINKKDVEDLTVFYLHHFNNCANGDYN